MTGCKPLEPFEKSCLSKKGILKNECVSTTDAYFIKGRK